MKIGNQEIRVTERYLQVFLHQPFWGAWKQYGWTEGIEGLGVNILIVSLALTEKKKIRIKFPYGTYEISPKRAITLCDQYKSYFEARNGTILIVIPRDKCLKIKGKESGVFPPPMTI